MNRLRIWQSSSIAFLLAAGATLQAQETTGSLSGKVLSTSGEPVAMAQIRIESTALFQPRVTATNDKGEWRAPLLPVGSYSIRVSKDGFLGQSALSVRVGVATSQRLDFTLKPLQEAIATVEVTATNVAADKADPKIATNYSEELLRTLPSAPRSTVFDGALALAPGALGRNFGIRGSQSGVGYVLDGIDVKDKAMDQPVIAPLQDSVEDTQVVQSTVSAREGRVSGGQVKVVTRSGSNTFEGSLRANYSRDAWRAEQKFANQLRTALVSAYDSKRDLEATLSGPILKDRVWFYVGSRFTPKTTGTKPLDRPFWPEWMGHSPVTLIDNPTSPSPFGAFFGAANAVLLMGPGGGYRTDLGPVGGAYSTKGKTSKLDLKITGALTPDHIVAVAYFLDHQEQTGTGDTAPGLLRTSAEFFGPEKMSSKAYSLSWNGTLTKNLLIEASHFVNSYEGTSFPGPQSKPVSLWTMVGDSMGSPYGFGPFPLMRLATSGKPERHISRNTKVNLRYYADLAGSHEMDFGFESADMLLDAGRASGQAADRVVTGGFYRDPQGNYMFPTVQYTGETAAGQGQYAWLYSSYSLALAIKPIGPAPVYIRSYGPSGESATRTRSIYVNDTWAINEKWGMNLGLRLNNFRAEDIDGSRLLNNSFLEPRFQLRWNPDGAGRNSVSLTLARYAQEYTNDWARQIVTDPTTVYTVQGWKGLAGQPLPGDPSDPDGLYGVRFVTYDQLIDRGNYGPAIQYQDSRQLRDIAGVKVPYANEVSLSFKHVGKAGQVGLSLTQREYKDNMVQVLDYGFANFVLVQDPSGSGGAPRWQQRRLFRNNPDSRIFRTAEFDWTQPLSSRLSWGGSITYFQQLGTYAKDYYSLLKDSQYGASASDMPTRTLQAKGQKLVAYWSYVHPIGRTGNITFGLMGSYAEGGGNQGWLYGLSVFQPFTGVSPMIDPTGNGYAVEEVTPGFQKIYAQQGAFKKGKDAYDFALKVDWKIPLGYKRLQLVGNLTIAEVFNHPRFIGSPYFGEAAPYWDPTAVPGRPMRIFTHQPGSNPNENTMNAQNDYSGPRVISQFSAGLRF